MNKSQKKILDDFNITFRENRKILFKYFFIDLKNIYDLPDVIEKLRIFEEQMFITYFINQYLNQDRLCK